MDSVDACSQYSSSTAHSQDTMKQELELQEVCVERKSTFSTEQCNITDANGSYTLRKSTEDLESLDSTAVRVEGIDFMGESLKPYNSDIKYKKHTSVDVTRHNSNSGTTFLSNSKLDGENFTTVIFTNPLTERSNFFEIEISSERNSDAFAIGLGPIKYPLTAMPGWIEGSLGYHANGSIFIEQGDVPIKAPIYKEGDRIGCGLDFSTADEGFTQVWFTKNGRLACWPEKIQVDCSVTFYPLISVGSYGEVIHFCDRQEQSIPDIATVYKWYETAGFQDLSEVPFYSREESISKYGVWQDDEDSSTATSDHKLPWDEVRDALSKNFPGYFRFLVDLSPPFFNNWAELAEAILKGNEKFAKIGKGPNGTLLGRFEHLSLHMAQEVVDTFEGLKSGLNTKLITILAYLSLGLASPHMNIAVVSGLLFMGHMANSSIKHSHVFHNPDISVSLVHLLLNWGGNPNVPDAIGRTPLHIHQNNRAVMRTFLDHNADVNVLDDERSTPLHYAGLSGNTGAIGLLMEHGASASRTFGGQPSSMDVTAAAGNSSCFKQMLKHSIKKITAKKVQQQMVEDKWKDAVSDLPKWKRIKLKEIEEMTNDELYYVTVKQHSTDSDRFSLRKLVSVANDNSIELKDEVFATIFDHCLYGQNMVIADILDADIHGDVEPETSSTTEGTSLLAYLSKHPKVLLPLVSHDTLKAYIADQWQKKALMIFWFRILFYLFQLILLTFALTIAARPGITDAQLNTYSSPIDIFRGVCEGCLLALIIANMIDEILEIFVGSISSYILDITNYFQWLGILCLLLIIPFRVINHPGQWVVASIAYLAFGLKAFYFASLFNSTGTYVQTLAIIVSRDVVKFLSMFLIVLVVFGGAFYFSLRYSESLVILRNTTDAEVAGTPTASNVNEPAESDGSQYHSGEGSFLYEVYFIGLRTMIESGAVFDYVSEDADIEALAVIWYLLFLFIVVIVLLNVLIAQVSDTYAKILEKAEGYKLFNQCLYIAKLEEQDNKMCMTRALYSLSKKLNCLQSLYQCCCKRHWLRKYVRKFSKRVQVPPNRPRVLWTGKAEDGSTSKLQNAKRKLQQIAAQYIPDTSSSGSNEADSPTDSTENLELKMDITGQNLKELGEGIHAVLKKQQEMLTTMMLTNQSSLMTQLTTQQTHIENELVLSKEQEDLMFTMLSQVKDLRAEMLEELHRMKLQHAEEKVEVQCKLTNMMHQQECYRREITAQQDLMKEQVLQQQEKLGREIAAQRDLMEEQHEKLTLLEERQQELMSSFAKHGEELSKTIKEEIVSINKDFLYLFETSDMS